MQGAVRERGNPDRAEGPDRGRGRHDVEDLHLSEGLALPYLDDLRRTFDHRNPSFKDEVDTVIVPALDFDVGAHGIGFENEILPNGLDLLGQEPAKERIFLKGLNVDHETSVARTGKSGNPALRSLDRRHDGSVSEGHGQQEEAQTVGIGYHRGMVEPERIATLTGAGPARGSHVLYWMQHSQRAIDNPALTFALTEAQRLDLPLLVLFVLLDYPAATAVHYRFMLAGLRETAGALRARGIGFALQRAPAGDPVPLVAAWAGGKQGGGGRENGDRHGQSALVVCDRGYLRHEEAWRLALAERLAVLGIPLLRVDADTVVPADAASLKLEWSAATLRRKIEGAIHHYAQPSVFRGKIRDAASLGVDQGANKEDSLFEAYAKPEDPAHRGDPSPGQQPSLRPGSAAARVAFKSFLDRLDRYEGDRNDPNLEGTSGMSPYLHFGQISCAAMARSALERGGPGAAAFVEQLVVRRELAINLCLREPNYDVYDHAVPEWARRSLAQAAGDRRPWIHGRETLEAAATHDPYWNAAQNQLIRTGIIHNYMRMYWGKKIIEWSASPEEAFATALSLNDRYALDGRDPNGYAGVAWCFGRHDRPWSRRTVFGCIRYMNEGGLKRKFDREAYARRWS